MFGLAVLLMLVSPAVEGEDWRWQRDWALAEHFDLSLAPTLSLETGTQDLALPLGIPGLPASLRGSSLVSSGTAVLQRSRSGRSRPLLEYRGAAEAPIQSLALGGRGLLLRVEDPSLGGEAVLELRYRPAYEYPFRIGHAPRVSSDADARGHAVMAKAGCFSCHSLHGKRQVGPSLDRETLAPRLSERLDSDAYRRTLAELDASEEWALRRWREPRAEVLRAAGHGRLRVWMRWHLIEPSFDNLQARMPSMGLEPTEVEAVTDFLLGPSLN